MAANNFTNILNRLFPWRRARLNRKFKDHLFRFLFREKSELLSLYNAVNGTDYTDPNALTIMTLEDVIYLGMKNDVSFLIDGRLSIYEHQSSICPNMPLRGLFYFSQLLQGYVDQNNLNIYSSTKVSLPLPLYVVFYNGMGNCPERTELLLSDLFEKGTRKDAALECRAVVLNINEGYNGEIMKKCRTLADYSAFIQQIRKYQKAGFDTPQAVALAIDYCIEHDILADVLRKNRGEVTDMILTVYNEKLHNKTLREEGRAEGLREGLAKGRRNGHREINDLNNHLLEDGRMDDLKRSLKDNAFQEALLKEYGLDADDSDPDDMFL